MHHLQNVFPTFSIFKTVHYFYPYITKYYEYLSNTENITTDDSGAAVAKSINSFSFLVGK
jgi:hypothetical protein